MPIDNGSVNQKVSEALNPTKSRAKAKVHPEDYRQQNSGTINSAIALRAAETASSLQALDERLSQFEDRFADAAVDRIDSVALRIEQKIAQRLQSRQEDRQRLQIVDILDAYTVPDFALPPAIMPSAMGCLPM